MSQPTAEEIRREVSKVLRAAADPNALTFKQVRIDVERSMGLPEGSLQKESKSSIKTAVHSVMDELDAQAESEDDEDEEPSDHHGRSTSDKASQGGCELKGEGKRRVKAERSEAKAVRPEASKKRKAVASELGESGKTKKAASASKTAKGKKKAAGAVRGASGRSNGDGDDDDDDDDSVFVLSRAKTTRKQVSVKMWKNNVQVDIREYYEDRGSGEYKPTKKGITLNPGQWRQLREVREAVDDKIAAKRH